MVTHGPKTGHFFPGLRAWTRTPVFCQSNPPHISHRFGPTSCAHAHDNFYAQRIPFPLQLRLPPILVALNQRSPDIEIIMAKTTTLKEFESVFPKLVEDLLDHAKSYKLPEEFVNWYKAVGVTSCPLQSCELIMSPVSQCQHHWRKVQPWNVCSRLGFHAARSPPLRRAILPGRYFRMDDRAPTGFLSGIGRYYG